MWPFTAILTGVVAGIVHVASGPDHLAAIAPLAADARRRAWHDGLMWGIGHSGGTWVLAALAIAFRESIPVDLVSAWSERLVGIVLIGVGLWALRRAMGRHVHVHLHEHGGMAHVHLHVHGHVHDHAPSSKHVHRHGALGIGTLHGLAGTSHVLGILPALALPTRAGAVCYVVAFGLGSIVAMTCFACLLGLARASRIGRKPGTYRAVMAVSAAVAVGLGIVWLVQAGPASAPGSPTGALSVVRCASTPMWPSA